MVLSITNAPNRTLPTINLIAIKKQQQLICVVKRFEKYILIENISKSESIINYITNVISKIWTNHQSITKYKSNEFIEIQERI